MKIRIKVGDVELDYDGSETFLTAKLPHLIDSLRTVDNCNGDVPKGGLRKNGAGAHKGRSGKVALPSVIKQASGTSNQNQRFLATAVWLEQGGQKLLSTGDVAKALKTASQSKINNPSECLNRNVAKGFCEKDGKSFFVLDEGYKHVGAEKATE